MMVIEQKGLPGRTKPPMELSCRLVTSMKDPPRLTWIVSAKKYNVSPHLNLKLNANMLAVPFNKNMRK